MKLPEITHLQFFVLHSLAEGPKKGREIRQMLTEVGYQKSLAAFYQLMARLEDEGFVKGTYRKREVEGVHVKEAEYRLLKAGIQAQEQVLVFYLNQAAQAGSLQSSSLRSLKPKEVLQEVLQMAEQEEIVFERQRSLSQMSRAEKSGDSHSG